MASIHAFSLRSLRLHLSCFGLSVLSLPPASTFWHMLAFYDVHEIGGSWWPFLLSWHLGRVPSSQEQLSRIQACHFLAWGTGLPLLLEKESGINQATLSPHPTSRSSRDWWDMSPGFPNGKLSLGWASPQLPELQSEQEWLREGSAGLEGCELPKYWKISPLLVSPLLSMWLSHTTKTRCGAGVIPWHRLDVPQSNSDPTLSAWRWHQIPQVKVSVLQDCLLTCRRPTSRARKYRVSPAFLTPSTIDYRFQQLPPWVQLIF